MVTACPNFGTVLDNRVNISWQKLYGHSNPSVAE